MPTYDDSDDSDIERAKVLIDGQAVTPSEMDWQPSIGKAPSSRPNVSTYDSARGGGVMKPVRKEAAQPLTPSYNDNDSCSSSRSSSSSRSDGIHANATRGQPAAQPRAVPSGKSSGVVNRLTRSTATTKGGPNYGKVLSFAEEEEREQRRRERALREPRRLPDDKPKFTQPVERERLRKLAAPRTVEMPEAAVSPTENHQRTRHIDPALYERLGKRAGEEDVSTGSGEALAPRRVANAEATNRLAAPRPAPIATTTTHGDRSSSAPTARRGTPGAAYTRPVGSPGPRATGNAAVRRSRAALSNTEAFIKEFRDRKVSHYGGTTMLPEGPHFHHRAHHGQPSEEGHRRRNNDPTWSSMAAAASVLTGTAAGNGSRQGTVSPTTPQSSSSASYGRNHNVSIPHATRQALRQQQERERQAEANECKQVDSVFAPKDLTRAPRRIRAKRYVAPEDGESAWSPVGMGDDDFLDESEDRPPFAANRAAIPPVVMAGPKRSMSEPPLIIHAKRRKAAPPPEEEVEQPKRQAKKKK